MTLPKIIHAKAHEVSDGGWWKADNNGSEAMHGTEPFVRLADVRELVEALDWYREQARLARLIHSEGDKGRHALQGDGGKRAAAALAKFGDVK